MKILRVFRQIPVCWECRVCKKYGMFSLQDLASGVKAVDIALGIHRTLSLPCKMHDVTFTRKNKIITVVFQMDKSVMSGDVKKARARRNA